MGRRGPGLGNSLGCVGACQSPCLSRPACLTHSLGVGLECQRPRSRVSLIEVRAPVSNDVLHAGECCLQHSRHGRPSQPSGCWLPHGCDLQDHVGAPATRTSALRLTVPAPIRISNPGSWRLPRVLECSTDSCVPCFSGPESGDVRGARLGSCGCCRGFCVQADLISWSAEKLYVMHEILGRRVGVSSATERRVVRRVKHASRIPGVRVVVFKLRPYKYVFARGVHEVCMRALHTHAHRDPCKITRRETE